MGTYEDVKLLEVCYMGDTAPEDGSEKAHKDAGLYSDFFWFLREDGYRFLYETCEVPHSNKLVSLVPKAKDFFRGYICTVYCCDCNVIEISPNAA